MNKCLLAILGLALALGAAGCGKSKSHGGKHRRERYGVTERREHRPAKSSRKMKRTSKMDRRTRSEERNMFAK